MRTGVSYPGRTAGATCAMITGAAAADYPVQNLASLASLRTVFRASAAGAVALSITLPASRLVQFLGMVHHNAPEDATLRWRLYSDAGMTALLHDTGVMSVYPEGAEVETPFPNVRPHILDAALSTRAVRLDLSANASPWQIGGIDLAGWYEWPAVSVDRAYGVANKDVVVDTFGGAQHGMSQYAPRTFRGSRTEIEVSAEQTDILDFQMGTGLHVPFTFVQDYDDPATWARECVVVKNRAVPRLVKNGFDLGDFFYDLQEHLR